MLDGEDNNIQTDTQTYIAKWQNSYKEFSNQMGYKNNVFGVHILNLRMMLVGEDNNKQTYRQLYSIQKSQTHIEC